MPYLLVRTNTTISTDKTQTLLSRASALVGSALGKPERYVMISLESEVPMLFDAKETPCAYLELKSIGLPDDNTAALSLSLCTLITEELDIPGDRIYIEFADTQRHMWGWNGATF